MVCDDTSHIAKPHSPRDRYVGFYDVDNLDTISKEKIREHIEQCAGYAEKKKAMLAALAAQEAAVAAQDGGESSQEAKK